MVEILKKRANKSHKGKCQYIVVVKITQTIRITKNNNNSWKQMKITKASVFVVHAALS